MDVVYRYELTTHNDGNPRVNFQVNGESLYIVRFDDGVIAFKAFAHADTTKLKTAQITISPGDRASGTTLIGFKEDSRAIIINNDGEIVFFDKNYYIVQYIAHTQLDTRAHLKIDELESMDSAAA